MAAKKLEILLGKYQANAYPAMLDDLSQHLGVSDSSLRRLALGWAPVVKFKKGPNYHGWWVIPERDGTGQVLGLSLRSQRDTKVMYPGSKHGLIYEVNPDHRLGDSQSDVDFIRTMEAEVYCPICGKPDGCLVSDEDVRDPQAAICIRVRDGSERPMPFGHLHIRKEAGRLNAQASLLAPSDDPVVIVEGMTDTAAAMDLGLVAVGRPSNLACMDMLVDLVRGRRVIIVGENDAVNSVTGQQPGVEGMVAAYQLVKPITKSAVKLLPPDNYKDLRQWIRREGLDRDAFLKYAEDNGEQSDDIRVLPDDRKVTVARAFIMDSFRMAGRPTVRYWNSTPYVYTGSKYSELPAAELRQPLYHWSYKMQCQYETANGSVLRDLDATPSWIQAVLGAVEAETLVKTNELPCWINGSTGPEPHNLISFSNGVLDMDRWLDGDDDCLMDHTPDLFTLAALPYPFDPTATYPTWRKYLLTSLGHELETQLLLQEWFGYNMTTDTSMQKYLLMRGPKAAGKGVALNTLMALVGEEQSVATDFSNLTGPFGLKPLLGKLVCGVDEAQLTKSTDNTKAMDILRRIVGEAAVQINRKGVDHLDAVRLYARFTLTANEFPRMPDHAGAMARRMMVLDFPRSFEAGERDRNLERKLAAELPGIALWALRGLRRLREQGGFTVPPSSVRAMEEWTEDASPVSSFTQECVDFTEGAETQKRMVFEAFNQWAAERGMHPMSQGLFKERFQHCIPSTVVGYTPRDAGRKRPMYKNLSLVPWARKAYLGDPT